MSKISLILHAVHSKVHSDNSMAVKKKYSIGLYTGGVNIKKWSGLSDDEKENALSKQWYIRWTFRNPFTDKLERQDNIKIGNHFKTKEDRLTILNQYVDHLKEVLKKGYNPYIKDADIVSDDETRNSGEILSYALELKKSSVGATTYSGYEYTVTKFKKFLDTKALLEAPITSVTKKVVMGYLNKVANEVSAASRNSEKNNLSAIFTVLEENDIIELNFVKGIKPLKTAEKRDRTYSEKDLEKILKEVEQKDPLLLLYIKFVSYFFWRPIENIRLKVSDIDLAGRLMTDKTKTKGLKTKIIPDVIYNDLVEYMNQFPNRKKTDFLFTPTGIGEWTTTEKNKRGHFGVRYRRIKKELGYGAEYTIYSFRHTYITKAYIHLRTIKKLSKDKSIDVLSNITGHTSKAIWNYIHYIDAERPEDYSEMLE